MSGRVSILMYHQVGHFSPMRAHRANYCQVRRFAAQMAWLHYWRYPVLSLDEVLAAQAGAQPLPARAVALTFDDGYQNFLEHAWPVLRRYGFPATLYVISDWLGRQTDWFRADPGRPLAQLLSADEVRALHRQGVVIGSHSATHPRLAMLTEDAQCAELARSKAQIEALLDAPVRHLCYPFGSFNVTTVALAERLGYVSATTCLRGAMTLDDHPLVLPRKAISYGDNLAGFVWKLEVKQAPRPELLPWREHPKSRLHP